MITFLHKVSRLSSVSEVMLLSKNGEPLFKIPSQAALQTEAKTALWQGIIADMGNPLAADFVFAAGCCYLHATDLGYVLIGMKDANSLRNIRTACTSVQEKLADPHLRKKVLLKMLAAADEMLQPHCVRALLPFADREVVETLGTLLGSVGRGSLQGREKLLLAICQVFGHCPADLALPHLRKLLLAYQDKYITGGSHVIEAAETSIQMLLQSNNARAEISPGVGGPRNIEATARFGEGDRDDEMIPEEARIGELLSARKKREAVSLIMELIVTTVKAKQFAKAEKLRDRLIQIDSAAIMEIIQAAEIIDEGKSASISHDHLTIWKNLAEALTPEEFSSLYHVMGNQNYAEGVFVARQGAFLTTLFFVNSGRVQLYAVSQDREVPLNIVGPGGILGSETFFDVSVWTVNARSLGANVSLLSLEALLSLRESCPALQAKLTDFCSRFPSPNAIFTKTNRSRRKTDRKQLPGRVTLVILDAKGNDTRITAKGELLDISKGGVSFGLRFSKKKNAIALLGTKIRAHIRPDGAPMTVLRSGMVMAVRCHDFIGNDYSLHVEFEEEWNGVEMLQAIKKRR